MVSYKDVVVWFLFFMCMFFGPVCMGMGFGVCPLKCTDLSPVDQREVMSG